LVELKEFLQTAYVEKWTLDFHASQLFKARQGKDEKMAKRIHRIQTLGLQFCEAALLSYSEGVQQGVLDLSDHLCNIWFIQGLASDQIQTIVRSCYYQNFDKIAETALVEEGVIVSKQDTRPKECPHIGVVTAESWVTWVTRVTREAKWKLE
jgi:hypothetical protein